MLAAERGWRGVRGARRLQVITVMLSRQGGEPARKFKNRIPPRRTFGLRGEGCGTRPSFG